MMENKDKRRIPLKWKWNLLITGATLILLVLFSLIVFNRVSNVLINQAKAGLNDQAVVINKQLGKYNQIDKQIKIGENYPQQRVSIYDPHGKLISGNRAYEQIKPIQSDRITIVNDQHNKRLVGLFLVKNTKTNKLICYLRISNKFNNYNKIRYKLLETLFIFVLIGVIIISILSYWLAAKLLLPMNEIQKNINVLKTDPDSDQRLEINSNDELSDLGVVFNGMIDQTQRYIHQQQQFVEDVSHELRTPVAVIQGHLKLLLRWGKDDPKVLAESLNASLQETKRMESLVTEMLDLSRAEQIEINYGNEIANVNEVVNQVYNDFKMLHDDFTFTFDDDTYYESYIKIYRNHLEQLLIILLDNAIKYSETRKEIHLSLSSNTNMVSISVQDFGEGISKENLDKVFDRFFRVDKARSRNKGGNGLGLAIANRLVKAYQGDISIESSVGYGTIFQVSFPILKQDPK